MSIADHEQNRRSWNHATTRHHSHKPQLIEQYSLQNHNNLFEEDITLLGDLKGKFVVHLQCNDGQDTVSIAKFLKPRVCVGVDISDVACDFAKRLGKEVMKQQPQQEEQSLLFVRSDVLFFGETARSENSPLLNAVKESHDEDSEIRERVGKELKEKGADVVYASYGVICWISDLKKYVQSVKSILAPGGKYVLVEFHPFITGLDPTTLKVDAGMIGSGRAEWGGVGDYVGNDFEGEWKNPETSFEFFHGVADIISAFLSEDMILESFTEYPHINAWQPVKGMRERKGGGDRVYVAPEGMPENVPMMYSIVVRKK